MPCSDIPGPHAVTSICGDPGYTLDFPAGCLGQRLVKKKVTFEGPDTHHLCYGDAVGTSNTLMTFFPFTHTGPVRAGPGMASAVASSAFEGWMDRRALAAVCAVQNLARRPCGRPRDRLGLDLSARRPALPVSHPGPR
ncbi:hypothetical protein PVT71_24840 (plasmid) [Salipiger sp. H15]|uniref:Uncharacterized protein n=1 Tax=Alloyangia sp. H15 TaxID=3029062 RepID=A0AAU8AQM5_9RHOB